MNTQLSPFLHFNRSDWANLAKQNVNPLTTKKLHVLAGTLGSLSMEEVSSIYHPLSSLIELYVGALQDLFQSTTQFLGHKNRRVPYIIGVAGSVAVGKSTTSRILQELLSQGPNKPNVELVTTDGFLFPNKVLEKRSLMHRKGFPETYDISTLLKFVFALKSGKSGLKVPIYSHLSYDILPETFTTLNRPDIVIIEGLTVLQTGSPGDDPEHPRLFISDFFDFKIFVDAKPQFIQRWYIERFLKLRDTAFKDPSSYFHRYAQLDDDQARTFAGSVWSNINEINLFENILPTRERADLILSKDENHHVSGIRLRKI